MTTYLLQVSIPNTGLSELDQGPEVNVWYPALTTALRRPSLCAVSQRKRRCSRVGIRPRIISHPRLQRADRWCSDISHIVLILPSTSPLPCFLTVRHCTMAGQNTKSAEFRDSSGDENEFMDSKGLLEEYGKEQIILKRTGLRRGHKWCLFALVTLSLLLNVMLLSIGAFLYQRRGPASPIFPQALYCKYHHSVMGSFRSPDLAPAQDVLKYEVVKFDTAFGHGKTKYQGDPSPELDKLWEDLFLRMFTTIAMKTQLADSLGG